MTQRIVWCLILFPLLRVTAQHVSLKVTVGEEASAKRLANATVFILPLNRGMATDSSGCALFNTLAPGTYLLRVSYVGLETKERKIVVPQQGLSILVTLEATEDETGSDVVITATRTDRTLRNTATRVEVIAGGEISENISMKPGEIKMLLNESNGINTQVTSATSGTANLRLQELEGRYTQVLQDGLPIYAGLAEGLSLVQIAPLNLKQVEIIKGASSTLYGGGAITGLINLVTKTPGDHPELNILANASSAKGLDLSGFYSARNKHLGTTLFASRNSNSPFDPGQTGFTAIPKFTRYTLSPRAFYYSSKTTADAGLSLVTENRLGGSTAFINQGQPGYYENNGSTRLTARLTVVHHATQGITINFKNSYSYFNRTLAVPGYSFQGIQHAWYSELNGTFGTERSLFITGITVNFDNFQEPGRRADSSRDYRYFTTGFFLQHAWTISPLLSIQTGLRLDYTAPFGTAGLPQLSLLTHPGKVLTIRVGGGLGYKIPSLFTEAAEEIHFRNIARINTATTGYEKSAGGSADVTARFSVADLRVWLNPLIFYTRINNPLVLDQSGNGAAFHNANGWVDSKGAEFNIRLALDDIHLYTGYVYTIAQNHFDGNTSPYALAPRQRIHFDGVYEQDKKFRVALEAYYTGTQSLNDGTTGRSYWTFGALAEKSWTHLSVFVNSENLGNVRQSKWETLYAGPADQPVFKDIYAPLEGITVNAGFKLHW